jgi:hypothetical protein
MPPEVTMVTNARNIDSGNGDATHAEKTTTMTMVLHQWYHYAHVSRGDEEDTTQPTR